MSPAETALTLARAQFAFTMSFHFIFPAFSIGLASYLAVLEGLWLWTGRDEYIDLFRYWLKIFAVAFAMGVVSGIVMSYQFGTNWSVFSDRAGPVIGPLMAYEVLTAFFLEAGFLGVMLFGMKKVGRGLHFAATCAVAVGTFISAFWILSVNSWMQTPRGFTINADGQYIPAGDWLPVIFTPSFPYRLVHTVTGAYLTTALVVGAVGAWHLLKTRRSAATEDASAAEQASTADAGVEKEAEPDDVPSPRSNTAVRTMFSMAMWMAAIVAPMQLLVGDEHGINTLEHQPAKIMAMEGHYRGHPDGAPLILFGIPDDEAQRMRAEIAVPKLSSLILKHDLNAPMKGLDSVPARDRPPVRILFWSFRIMVGLGMLMILLGAVSLFARWRGKLYDWPLFHRFALVMGPAGFVAVIAGWVTTEVGRQPWTIYGQMRTADAVSAVGTPGVGGSLVAFVLVYFVVFTAGVVYLLRLMNEPPHRNEPEPAETPIRTHGVTGSHPAKDRPQGGHS